MSPAQVRAIELMLYSPVFKVGLLSMVIALAALRFVARRKNLPRFDKALRAGAVVAAVMAVLSFNAYAQPWEHRFHNDHDLFHYYFGAKYSGEIDSSRLYHCALLALDEIDPELHEPVRKLRSLSHYRRVRKGWYLEHEGPCKRHFEAERWEAFKRDIAAFDQGRRLRWRGLLGDKGYNATPVWNMVGRFFAQRLPLQPILVSNVLGSLDLLLLAAAFGLVFFSFGLWGGALGLVMLGGTYALTATHIRGSFLRLDWLACLLGAFAAYEWKKPRLAGALLGYAAMVRIFPILFLFGPAVIAAREIVTKRRLRPDLRRLFVSVALTCALLFGATLIDDKGPARWRDWLVKIELHTKDIANSRVGLEYLLQFRGETQSDDIRGADGKEGWRPHFVEKKQDTNRQMLPYRIALAVLTLAGLVYGMWRLGDPVLAMALSLPAVFVIVSPTFYYYCLTVPCAVVLAARSPKDRMCLGLLISLALWEIFFHASALLSDFDYYRFFMVSAALAAVNVGIIGALALRARRVGRAKEAAGGVVRQTEGT